MLIYFSKLRFLASFSYANALRYTPAWFKRLGSH